MQASTSLGAPLNLLTKIILKRLEKLTRPDMILYNELGQGNSENDEEAAAHRGIIFPYWGKTVIRFRFHKTILKQVCTISRINMKECLEKFAPTDHCDLAKF